MCGELMTSGIYLITNKINGHMYVGGSVDIEKRLNEHKRGKDTDNQAIDRAILNYGKENFIYQIITELPADWEIIGEHEKYWIKFYNTFKDSNHYNLTEGGEGVSGFIHTEETKNKISESLKGSKNPNYKKTPSNETRKKISDSLKGHKVSDKTRVKLSKSLIGNKNAIKNYCTIVKFGIRNKKQIYALYHDGDFKKQSINIFKLINFALKEYPDEDLEISMEVLDNALLS